LPGAGRLLYDLNVPGIHIRKNFKMRSAPFFHAVILAGLLAAGLPAAEDRDGNLLKNPGFEQRFRQGDWEFFSPLTSWQGVSGRSADWAKTGRFSLKMIPNKDNVTDWRPFDYALSQPLPADQFQGKPLYFGGWMRAEGGAVAVIRIVAALENGEILFRELRHDSPASGYWRDIMDIPDLPLKSLSLTCSVRGTAGVVYFDDVVASSRLVSTVTVGQPDPGPPLYASVTVDTGRVIRRIPRSIYGMNLEWVFNGHTIWDKYYLRLNDHLLNLASDLGVGIWRYPGGVFANYYDWRSGVGPYEFRPVAPIEPDGSLSEHGFGTDEALLFSAATGAADMMITVNPVTGTAEQAAEWVRYVNNGNRRVSYWEIGNELYLKVLDAQGEAMVWTPEEYADTFLEFAAAMRAADPSIQIGADIEYHYPFAGCARLGETGCWTDVILQRTAGQLDFLSLHNGFAPLGLAPIGGPDAGWDVRTVYAGMLAAPLLAKQLLDDLGKKIDALTGDNAPRIKIAATEWGPLFDVGSYSRLVDHVKTLGSALYVASFLKVLVEEPRVEMGAAFKLLDEVVFGWAGPRDGKYVPKAPYYAFQLYARHFRPNLVRTRTSVQSYDSRSVLGVPAIKGVPYLDVVSSVSDDGNTLSMIVVNKHFDRAIYAGIALRDFYATGQATAWTLTGTGIDANTGTELPGDYVPQTAAEPNGRFHQGGPGEVWVSSTDLTVSGSCFSYEFPPHSVTALVIRGAPDSWNPVECGDKPAEPEPYADHPAAR
jgi:alpha-N-arabinofuranosidase